MSAASDIPVGSRRAMLLENKKILIKDRKTMSKYA
jgi:hypothetical protein